MPKKLDWKDVEDLGILLHEKMPDVDPLTVSFTNLRAWVTGLPGFAGDPAASNEAKLEAIQMAWLEEYQSTE